MLRVGLSVRRTQGASAELSLRRTHSAAEAAERQRRDEEQRKYARDAAGEIKIAELTADFCGERSARRACQRAHKSILKA